MICTDKARVSFLKKEQTLNFKRNNKRPYGFIKQMDDHQIFTNGYYYIVLKGDSQIQDKDVYYHGNDYNEVITFDRGKKKAFLSELTKANYVLLPGGIDRLATQYATDYLNVKDLYCFLDAVQPLCKDILFQKWCCLDIGTGYYFEADHLIAALKLAFNKVQYVELDFNKCVVKITSEENDNVAYIMHLQKWSEKEAKNYELCPIYHLM